MLTAPCTCSVSGVCYGVNGADLAFASTPFGPSSDGGRTYLFLQGGSFEVSQNPPTDCTPGVEAAINRSAAHLQKNALGQKRLNTETRLLRFRCDPTEFPMED
jgi:hypothetical protein